MNSLRSRGDDARDAALLRWSLLLAVAFWFLAVLLLSVFEKDVWEAATFFIFYSVRWGLIGVGALLALAALRRVMPDQENRHCAAAALLLAVTGLVLIFLCREFLSMDVRFMLSRSHYDRRVEEVLAGRAGDSADVAGVERGPPDRVAFYWWRGVTDNWVELVHDPTGEVLQAQEFRRDWSNWSDPKLEKVRGLFGGAMYNARHLTGPWYICWFT